VEAPITLFGAIHPRIITTGQPHRRLGRSRLGRPSEAAPVVTRQTRGNPERAVAADLRREKPAEQATCQLQVCLPPLNCSSHDHADASGCQA
jgi:hypothetical protein